jgi:N-acetylneuraminic acid mutarotase
MSLECLLLIVCAPLVGVSAVHTRKLIWRERAALPQPRAGYMAGVVSDQYLVAGGSYWVNKQKRWTDQVDIFDPVKNTWLSSTPLPGPRSDGASIVYENRLYVFGGTANGMTFRDTLEFREEKWAVLPTAELPESRMYSVAVECKGAIYLIGGMSRVGDYTTVTNSIWMWKPDSPQTGWEVLSPVPGPGLINHAVAELGGKIYVLGGATHGGQDVVNVNSALEFDPETNQWKRLTDLPVSRRAWWGLVVPDGILLFGGYTNDFERDIFEYHLPSQILIHIGSMPHAICDAKFLRLQNSVIGAGGEVGELLRGEWTIEAHLPSN